jgi:hypothetical protein
MGDLIQQVNEQLNQLGTAEQDEVLVGEFLWEHLSRTAMEKAWSACDTQHLKDAGFPHPIDTFDHLKASTARCWADRRHCIHGDLNATNIAIDAANPEQPRAYIFDAAGMRADFGMRDLATLEVTSILFNSTSPDHALLTATMPFYDSEFCPVMPAATNLPDFSRNVLSCIRAIRSGIQADSAKVAYALLVFGAALQQLSGLGFQPSPNKVRNPVHACWLAAWAAKWIKSIAPHLFEPST